MPTPTPVAPHMLPPPLKPLSDKALAMQLQGDLARLRRAISDALCLLQWQKPDEAAAILNRAVQEQEAGK